MANEQTIVILNRLLEAEYSNFVPRLGECSPFVSMAAEEDQAVVQRMLAEAKSHEQELAQLIVKLRGSPLPPTYPLEAGSLHYLSLSYLMPQVLAGLRGIIGAYECAAASGDAEADALISRIQSDHRRHLALLEKMHSNLLTAAGK